MHASEPIADVRTRIHTHKATRLDLVMHRKQVEWDKEKYENG